MTNNKLIATSNQEVNEIKVQFKTGTYVEFNILTDEQKAQLKGDKGDTGEVAYLSFHVNENMELEITQTTATPSFAIDTNGNLILTEI